MKLLCTHQACPFNGRVPLHLQVSCCSPSLLEADYSTNVEPHLRTLNASHAASLPQSEAGLESNNLEPVISWQNILFLLTVIPSGIEVVLWRAVSAGWIRFALIQCLQTMFTLLWWNFSHFLCHFGAPSEIVINLNRKKGEKNVPACVNLASSSVLSNASGYL